MVVVEIGSKNRTIGSQKVDIRERLWVTKRPSMGRPGYTGAGRPASDIPKAEIRARAVVRIPGWDQQPTPLRGRLKRGLQRWQTGAGHRQTGQLIDHAPRFAERDHSASRP